MQHDAKGQCGANDQRKASMTMQARVAAERMKPTGACETGQACAETNRQEPAPKESALLRIAGED